MNISSLPWRMIRRVAFTYRKEIAAVEKPQEKHLVVDKSKNYLTDILRGKHFREGWFLSYYYHGEDANLCRAGFKDDKFEDYQLHIRLFERKDGRVEIYTHYELDPIKHPRKHLNEVNKSTEKGIEMAKTILNKHNIDFVEA